MAFLSSHHHHTSHRHDSHHHHHHHHHHKADHHFHRHEPHHWHWHWVFLLVLWCFSNIVHAGVQQARYIPLSISHGPHRESIFIQGQRAKDDRLIFNHSIVTHSVFKTAAVRNVDYPPENKFGYKISYIQVIDKTGYTSRVSVAEGGIGYRHVTLRLISHQNTGLDYSIKMYTSEPMYFMDGIEVPPQEIQDILNNAGAKLKQNSNLE